MKRHIYHFNLIEIVLTVAVIAFGVVVILGMLPKGLQATRNAGMEAYASEIIDQMASYLQKKGSTIITTAMVKEADEKAFINDFDSESDTDNFIMKNYLSLIGGDNTANEFDVSKFKRTAAVGVYRLDDNAENSGNAYKSIYIVALGNMVTIDGDSSAQVDFSGMLRVWKRPRVYEVIRINHKGSIGVAEDKINDDHDCMGDADAPCGSGSSGFERKNAEAEQGATVVFELSYPLSLPYSDRTKRYYVFEVEK